MQNPFSHQAFSMAELTEAINLIPNSYGLLNQMNLMPFRGVTTRTVLMEERNGVLTLLPSAPVGAPGTVGKAGSRKVRSFVVPHIPHDDVVLASEVEGIRAFGSENQLESVQQKVLEKLTDMRAKHDITLEHLRMGALKGIIIDGDGSTTLYNLYTEFGITAKTVDFVLGTATTDVRAKCMEVVRHIEDNLLGEVMTGVEALVSEEFFDKLTSHAKVKEAFQNYQEASQRLGGDVRQGFTFGGIKFSEYRGKATTPAGASSRFIAASEGHSFPVGTVNTFKTLAAPADFNETVNTIGRPYYAKQEPRKFGRGTDLHTQSNPLPICMRPGVLVKVHSSN